MGDRRASGCPGRPRPPRRRGGASSTATDQARHDAPDDATLARTVVESGKSHCSLCGLRPVRFRHGRHRCPEARPRRLAQALHLHRRARPAPRVDPQLRRQGAAPARGGVGGDHVPRLGLPAHGRARLPRPHLPRGVRRPGRRLLLRARARRGDDARQLRRPRHGHRGPHGHGDPADPPVRHRAAEAGLPGALDQGREDRLPRDHRARRRLRRRRDQDARRQGRRRVRHQRLEDLHHQRPPRRLHRARDQDRPRRRLRRLHAVHRRHGPARRDPREEAAEDGHARLRHGAARLPGRARARRARCSARSARASTTSCGSSRASG